jgi:hypothetical protein
MYHVNHLSLMYSFSRLAAVLTKFLSRM